MSDFWTNIKKNLKDGYQTFSQKTEELTHIGRLKLEIIAIKRDIEKAFIELGGRVYQAFEDKSQDNIVSDEKLIQVVNRVQKLQTKLKSIEETIAQVKVPDKADSE